MLVTWAALALLGTAAEPAAPPAAPVAAEAPGRAWTVSLPVMLTAQAPPSNVDTVIVPWLGVRAGLVDANRSGLFSGAEGQLLFGNETQGTSEVSGSRLSTEVSGRGLVGVRQAFGQASVGGYGVTGVGVGVGLTTLKGFDASTTRPFGLWSWRSAVGLELLFRWATVRIEAGAGVRDARLELNSSLSAGATF